MKDNNGVDLKKLIQKLEHNLQEVRERSINNLLSKLENGIISIESLLHYHELYKSLLQWLNRHEDEEKVLELIAVLSEHSSGCHKLISYGGVEFFTSFQHELSCNQDSSNGNNNKKTVEKILNNLFYHDSDIHYVEPNINEGKTTQHNLQELNGVEDQSKLMEILTNHESKNTTMTEVQKKPAYQYLSSEEQASYNIKDQSQTTTVNANDSPVFEGYAKQTFQWLPLTSGDRQILAVTESRLQSSSSNLIVQSCDFITNVLLHDFPAEVFIQRPNIVKTLLSVLSINKSKQGECVLNILQTLSDMCRKLHQRLIQNQNVDVWEKQLLPEDLHSMSASTNATHSSSLSSKTSFQQDIYDNARPSPQPSTFNNTNDVIPREETDIQISEGMESTIMTEALIQAQLSLQEFLIKIFLGTSDLLKLYLHHNNLFTTVITLHKHALNLMMFLDMKTLWDSSAGSHKSIIYNEMTVLSTFSDVTVAVRQSSGDKSTATEQEITLKSIILCKIVIGFLNSCIPLERVYEVVPEDLSHFLKLMLTNVSLMNELTELQTSLKTVLNNLDENYMRDYNEASATVKSIKKLDCFFALFTKNKAFPEEVIIELSKEICKSLSYHGHEEFIRRLLYICCEKHTKEKEVKNNKWKDLFMHVVTHSTLDVKIKSYTVVLEILKDAFSDSLVSHPLSTKHQKATVVIQKELLRQVAVDCFHGNEQLKSIAATIIQSILTSQLNMSALLAKTVVIAITPILAILESNIGCSDQAFDTALLSLLNQPLGVINAEGEFMGLSTMEHTRAVFRLMYHKLPKVRSKGFALSLVHLTDYDKENRKVVNYSKENCKTPEDLLVFNARDLIGFQSMLSHFETITEENVEKLWKVFKDELVDEGLRHSAADQLSVILQDPSFHVLIVTNNEYKYILEQLSFCLHTKSREMRISANVIQKKFLTSLIRMLKNLAYHQPAIRHLLSVNTNVYMQLLQTVFLFSRDYEIRFYASSLLCLLLFDDVINCETDEKLNVRLNLPRCVVKNFRFPIEFTAIPENLKTPVAKDLLQTNILREFITRKCWLHMEWYRDEKSHSLCNKNLQLSDEEKEKYRTMNVKNIVTSMTQRCLKPSNHIDAIESLNQLRLLFIVFHTRTQTSDSKKSSETVVELTSIFKEGFLRQVVGVSPVSEDDQRLFASVITFINTVIQLAYTDMFVDVEDVLMSDVMIRMMQGTPHDDQNNCVKWLRILKQLAVTSISSLLSCSPLNASICVEEANITTASKTMRLPKIGSIIKAIYGTLSITGSESYYDLPLMEFMLECLMHLLAIKKWSLSIDEGEQFCIELFNWFAQILVSFHVDRVSASFSFMGKGIVQKTAVCLCHLVHEIKLFSDDGEWIKLCISTNETSLTSQHSSILPQSPLPWLIPLLSDRLADIRFCGWAFSTALVCDKIGQQLVINEFQSLPGGLWAAGLGVILDEKECFAVRSQAATLLTSLVQTKKFLTPETDETIWNSIVVQDTSSKMEVTGIHAFLLLLDHFEFFTELRIIFSSNNKNNNNIKNTTLINVSTSFSQSSINQKGGNSTSSTTISSANGHTSDSQSSMNKTTASRTSSRISLDRNSLESKPTASPLFKNSLLRLVCNLIQLSPETVMKKLDEHHVIDIILSSWLRESTDFTAPLLGDRKMNRKTPNSSIGATSSIVRLLELLHTQDATKCCVLIESYDVLTKLFHLLALPNFKVEVSSDQLMLWNQCMCVIGQFYDMENRKIKETFNELSIKHLPDLCDNLEILLNNCKHKDVVNTLSLYLNFILLLLKDISQNNIHRSSITIDAIKVSAKHKSDKEEESEKVTSIGEESKKLTSIGERLCKLLMTLYGRSYVLKEPFLLKDVLRCLFTFSMESKGCAIENGFVESVIEELKDKLVKLNMLTAFEKDEDKTTKSFLLEELCSLMDLIRNFMIKSGQAKLAFLQLNLIVHLQNVWSWSHVHENLRICLLEMMTVFSAGCDEACIALCTSSSLPLKQSLDESSFVNYIIKLLIRHHNEASLAHGKLNPCLRTLFELLTNTMSVNEGRTCFYKANSPQLLQQAHSLTTFGNKNQRHIAKTLVYFWLRLYALISFHTDGIKYISKIRGVTRFLLDVTTESSTKKQEFGLMTIRNLMFLPASKQMLSSNNEVINVMMQMLSGNSLKFKLHAISFFSLMLYDNQKGKGLLSKIGLHKKLLSLQDDIQTGKALTQDGDLRSQNKLVPVLRNTIRLLQD